MRAALLAAPSPRRPRARRRASRTRSLFRRCQALTSRAPPIHAHQCATGTSDSTLHITITIHKVSWRPNFVNARRDPRRGRRRTRGPRVIFSLVDAQRRSVGGDFAPLAVATYPSGRAIPPPTTFYSSGFPPRLCTFFGIAPRTAVEKVESLTDCGPQRRHVGFHLQPPNWRPCGAQRGDGARGGPVGRRPVSHDVDAVAAAAPPTHESAAAAVARRRANASVAAVLDVVAILTAQP